MEPNGRLWCVSRVAVPDACSVEQLYADAYHRLVGILDVVCDSRSEAEEVVQEAFVRLIPRAVKIMGYDDPEAWVRAVAFRLASNKRRDARSAARRWARMAAPEPVALTTDSATSLDVASALSRTSRLHREVLVLHYVLNHSVNEMAEILKVPTGTIKSRLLRAREQFSTHYGQEVDDVGSA